MRRTLVGKEGGIEAYKLFNMKERGGRLGLVFADGGRCSLPYQRLVETELDLAMGAIVLHFYEHRVTIEGRNLIKLYEGLEDEDVGEITERHAHENDLGPETPYVVELICVRLKDEQSLDVARG
ncbi:MAG: hypothetical protein NW215_00640 [Hyphomicrobiales bacterium]|nr:hypothetical protein [Hyphomicrobiales bacterium]